MSGLSQLPKTIFERIRREFKHKGGGFHSFGVNWVTLAQTTGVPLGLVQQVTGHKNTDIVLEHYVQPRRDAFRQALSAAMPSPADQRPQNELRAVVKAMNAKKRKTNKARILKQVEKL